MPLGTKWRIELETTEPVGDLFIEGIIIDGLGQNEMDGGNITKSVKVKCLKEITEEQYKKRDEEQKKWDKEHGIVHGI